MAFNAGAHRFRVKHHPVVADFNERTQICLLKLLRLLLLLLVQLLLLLRCFINSLWHFVYFLERRVQLSGDGLSGLLACYRLVFRRCYHQYLKSLATRDYDR